MNLLEGKERGKEKGRQEGWYQCFPAHLTIEEFLYPKETGTHDAGAEPTQAGPMGSGMPSPHLTLCLNGMHVTPGMPRGVAPTRPVTLDSGSVNPNHIQQGGFRSSEARGEQGRRRGHVYVEEGCRLAFLVEE